MCTWNGNVLKTICQFINVFDLGSFFPLYLFAFLKRIRSIVYQLSISISSRLILNTADVVLPIDVQNIGVEGERTQLLSDAYMYIVSVSFKLL